MASSGNEATGQTAVDPFNKSKAAYMALNSHWPSCYVHDHEVSVTLNLFAFFRVQDPWAGGWRVLFEGLEMQESWNGGSVRLQEAQTLLPEVICHYYIISHIYSKDKTPFISVYYLNHGLCYYLF
jgi:hypothetical protein